MSMRFYGIIPFLLQLLFWPVCRLLFWIFAGLQVRGLENVEHLPRGVIFASNHMSELDSILVPLSLPFLSRFAPMFYISRPKPFYYFAGWRRWIYGGLFFKALGAYPAVSGKRDYERTLKDHICILRDGFSMAVFPEGARNFDGSIKKVHGGVAYLSYKVQTPIVPVKIRNSHMTWKQFLARKRQIRFTFGKPIYPRELFHREPIVNEERNDFKEAAWRVAEVVNGL